MNIDNLENKIDSFIKTPTFSRLRQVLKELDVLSETKENYYNDRNHIFCASLVYDVICWSKLSDTIDKMPKIKQLLSILKEEKISVNEFIELRESLEDLDLNVTPE